MISKIRKIIMEVINEEQLDEKLITYSNRSPYGQVVFLAGGAGSGKGFAGSHFLDSAGFKVRDVDEMKKALQKMNRLGKIDVDKLLKKFGKNIKPKDMKLVTKVFNTELPRGGKQTIRNLNLKNPDHVYVLHLLVKAMGIKDKSLMYLLQGKDNPETLPNILFDITAKDLADITDVLPQLKEVGYDAKNVHLTWILTNYVTAMENNKTRERMVPEDILLKTHEGASNTVWSLITRALPKGLNGRVDVILNNPEHTVFYTDPTGATDEDGKPVKVKGIAKGFLSLPVKKQGGGLLPEKLWKKKLFMWVKQNAPESITKYM